eukprot:m51a1_g11155 hypothetical protein (940) ;mRNA; r:259697-274182
MQTVFVFYKNEAVSCEIALNKYGSTLKQEAAKSLDLVSKRPRGEFELVLPDVFGSTEALRQYATPETTGGKERLVLRPTAMLQEEFFDACGTAAKRGAFVLVSDLPGSAPQGRNIFSTERRWFPGDFESAAGQVLRSKNALMPAVGAFKAMSGHMTQKFIVDVLQYLSDAGTVHLECNRNVIEATLTQLGQRPDALFHERDSKVLVLKGEEKRFNIQHAIDELTSKMIPFNTLRLGNLPYLFCYASDASRLRFYVIEKGNEKKATPVTDMLDLGTIDGRLSVLLTVVNIYRIIGSFKNNVAHIAKYVHVSADNADIGFLRTKLYPYLHILDGLAVLHAFGIAHRDVRAPNVVYDQEWLCWVLIDVDFAAEFENNWMACGGLKAAACGTREQCRVVRVKEDMHGEGAGGDATCLPAAATANSSGSGTSGGDTRSCRTCAAHNSSSCDQTPSCSWCPAAGQCLAYNAECAQCSAQGGRAECAGHPGCRWCAEGNGACVEAGAACTACAGLRQRDVCGNATACAWCETQGLCVGRQGGQCLACSALARGACTAGACLWCDPILSCTDASHNSSSCDQTPSCSWCPAAGQCLAYNAECAQCSAQGGRAECAGHPGCRWCAEGNGACVEAGAACTACAGLRQRDVCGNATACAWCETQGLCVGRQGGQCLACSALARGACTAGACLWCDPILSCTDASNAAQCRCSARGTGAGTGSCGGGQGAPGCRSCATLRACVASTAVCPSCLSFACLAYNAECAQCSAQGGRAECAGHPGCRWCAEGNGACVEAGAACTACAGLRQRDVCGNATACAWCETQGLCVGRQGGQCLACSALARGACTAGACLWCDPILSCTDASNAAQCRCSARGTGAGTGSCGGGQGAPGCRSCATLRACVASTAVCPSCLSFAKDLHITYISKNLCDKSEYSCEGIRGITCDGNDHVIST